VPGSLYLRRVKVPLNPRPRVDIQKWGQCLTGRRRRKVWRSLRGHEGESWRQPRGTSSRLLKSFGGQGVHREVESEGFAENHRVVLKGSDPPEEPVGPSWGMVEPALWRRRRCGSIPAYHGVCGRHGGEERQMTQGDLVGSEGKVGLRWCGTRRRKGEQRRRQTATYSPRREGRIEA
jgi:hypothetical protein